MRFCIGLPNFIQIRWSAIELWRHINLPKWWPQRRKSTSGFRLGNVSHLWMLTAIHIQNIDKISQYTADILLLPVSENKHPPYWNSTSGLFHFDLFVIDTWSDVIPYRSTNFYPNSTISDGVMTSQWSHRRYRSPKKPRHCVAGDYRRNSQAGEAAGERRRQGRIDWSRTCVDCWSPAVYRARTSDTLQ